MLSLTEAKKQIDQIIGRYQRESGQSPVSVLASSLTKGKVYEALALTDLLQNLERREEYKVIFKGGSQLVLRSAGGPIKPRYPHFELRNGRLDMSIWTDIWFLALSHSAQGSPIPPAPGDFHELDIVGVPPGTRGMPRHDQILFGVECKATAYDKGLLRSILGVRRELSFLQPPSSTGLRSWPRSEVPAHPPSVLLTYCTDPSVLQLTRPGETFGIDFIHLPIP